MFKLAVNCSEFPTTLALGAYNRVCTVGLGVVTQKVYMFSATMNKYRRPQHIQQLYQLRDLDTDLYTDVEHRAISINTGDVFAAGEPDTP